MRLKKEISLFFRKINLLILSVRLFLSSLSLHKENNNKRRNVVFVTQLYSTDNPQRNQEILHSLYANLRHSFINHFIVFCEDGFRGNLLPADKRIQILPLASRLGYKKAFKTACHMYPGSIIILSNSDIEHTTSLKILISRLNLNHFVCLSRYEPNHKIFAFHLPETMQDSWILQDSPFCRDFLETIPDNIFLGMPCCDNYIAYKAYDYGFQVWNPCLDVISYHHHISDVRSYDKGTTPKYPPPYAYPPEAFSCQLFMKKSPKIFLKFHI